MWCRHTCTFLYYPATVPHISKHIGLFQLQWNRNELLQTPMAKNVGFFLMPGILFISLMSAFWCTIMKQTVSVCLYQWTYIFSIVRLSNAHVYVKAMHLILISIVSHSFQKSLQTLFCNLLTTLRDTVLQISSVSIKWIADRIVSWI